MARESCSWNVFCERIKDRFDHQDRNQLRFFPSDTDFVAGICVLNDGNLSNCASTYLYSYISRVYVCVLHCSVAW